MAQFQKRDLEPPRQVKAKPTPDFKGKWVKKLETTPKLKGGQDWCVAIEGLTGDELQAKIQEIESSRECLIEVIPKNIGQKGKNGYPIRSQFMHPMIIDRHGIGTDGKPFAVVVVELPTFERKRLAEKRAAEIEKARQVLAEEEAKATAGGEEPEEEAGFDHDEPEPAF